MSDICFEGLKILVMVAVLDFSEQTASLNGKPLTLSPMEYKMLNLFRQRPHSLDGTVRPVAHLVQRRDVYPLDLRGIA